MAKKSLLILSIIIILVLFLSACEQENIFGEAPAGTSIDDSLNDNKFGINDELPKLEWSRAPADVFLSFGEGLSFVVSAEVVGGSVDDFGVSYFVDEVVPVNPVVPVVPSSPASGVAVDPGVAVVDPVVPVVPSGYSFVVSDSGLIESVGVLVPGEYVLRVSAVLYEISVVPSGVSGVSGAAVDPGVAVVINPVVPVVPSGDDSFVVDVIEAEMVVTVTEDNEIHLEWSRAPSDVFLSVGESLSFDVSADVVGGSVDGFGVSYFVDEISVVPVVPSGGFGVSGAAVNTGVVPVDPVGYSFVVSDSGLIESVGVLVPGEYVLRVSAVLYEISVVPVVPSGVSGAAVNTGVAVVDPVVPVVPSGDDSSVVEVIEAYMTVTVTEDNQVYLQWIDNYGPREVEISKNSLSKNIPILAKVMNADTDARYDLKYSLINFNDYTNLISINFITGVITANEGLSIGNYNFDVKAEIEGVEYPSYALPNQNVDPSYVIGTSLTGNMDIKIIPPQMPYNIKWVEEPNNQIVEFGSDLYYDIDAEIEGGNVEAEILYDLNEIGYTDELIDPETINNIAGVAIAMNNNAQASIANFIIDPETGEIRSNGKLAVGTYNIELTATLLSYSPINVVAQEHQDLPIAGAAIRPQANNMDEQPSGFVAGGDEPLIDPSATSTTTSGTTTQTGRDNQIYVNEISKTITIQVVNSFNQCKLIINTPGMIYTLNKDLTNCNNDFVVMINADNAGIDCQGHKIKTSGNNAIFAQKANGVIIKNCNIELNGDNSQGGIILSEVNNAKVIDNKVKAPSYALYIDKNSKDNKLINNDLTVTKSYLLADNSNIDEYNKLIYENEYGRIEWDHTSLTINEAGTVGLNKASGNFFQQLTEGISNFVAGIFTKKGRTVNAEAIRVPSETLAENDNIVDAFSDDVEYDSSIIINKNFIGVDTDNYPSLTKSAKLSFSNLDFSDYAEGTKYPKRNSQECGEICNNFVKISDNEYSFDVTTFSYYSIGVRDVNDLELYWDIVPENQDINYGEEFYYIVHASGSDDIRYTIEELTDIDYPDEVEQINNQNMLTGAAVNVGINPNINNNFEEENNNDIPNNCANNGEKVYINLGFGSTECCDNNAGIKPVASLNLYTDNCVAPSNGQIGTCVVGWDQTCGDGTCSDEEDKCNCPNDCENNNGGNVTCTSEGEITNPTLGPNYYVACCDDLELFYLGITNEAGEVMVGSPSVCYDATKGEPICNEKGTDNEGYYYPNGNLLLLRECDGQSNTFVKTQNFAIDTIQGIIMNNELLSIGEYILNVTAYDINNYAEPISELMVITILNPNVLQWYNLPESIIFYVGDSVEFRITAIGTNTIEYNFVNNYECFEIDSLSGVIKSTCDLEAGNYTLEVSASDLSGELEPIYGTIEVNILDLQVQHHGGGHSGGGSPSTTTCEPNWECTDWTPSNCPVTGRKLRSCNDLNNCNNISSKPETSKYCNYVSAEEQAIGFEIEEPALVSSTPPANQQTPQIIKGNTNLLTIIIVVVLVLLLAGGGFFLFKKLKS